MKHQQQQQHLLFPTYKLWTCSPNAHMFSYQAQAQANFCCLFKDQADDTIACSAIERATPTIQILTQKLQNRVKPFFSSKECRDDFFHCFVFSPFFRSFYFWHFWPELVFLMSPSSGLPPPSPSWGRGSVLMVCRWRHHSSFEFGATTLAQTTTQQKKTSCSNCNHTKHVKAF